MRCRAESDVTESWRVAPKVEVVVAAWSGRCGSIAGEESDTSKEIGAAAGRMLLVSTAVLSAASEGAGGG